MRAAVVLAICSLATTALADPARPPDPEQRAEATRLFTEGRALVKEGKHAEACERFARSWELERAIGTQLNHADCLERQRDHRAAWMLFMEAAKRAEQGGQAVRAKFARGRAAAISRQFALLIVKIPRSPVGLTITVGGRPVTAQAEVRALAAPGVVEVAVTDAALGKRYAVEVATVAGTLTVVAIPASLEAPARASFKAGGRRRGWLYLAGGLAAGSAASLVTSVLVQNSADGTFRELTSEGRCVELGDLVTCDSEAARNQWRAATTQEKFAKGFAVGSAVLVTGAIVVFLAAPREQIRVQPVASADAVGLFVTGRF